MKSLKIILLTTLYLPLLSGCSTNKDLIVKNCGFYNVKTTKSLTSIKPVVYGRFYDCKTKLPLHYPRVKLNNSVQFKAGSTGNFKFSIKPGTYKFVGAGLPYVFLETKPVQVNIGDSIKIDFYLEQDITPLIDKN